MERNEPKGHGAMFAANFMWGLMSPVTKFVFLGSAITPVLLVNIRIIGAAALFWAASLFAKPEHVDHHDLLRLFFAALLGIVFNQGVYTVGLGLTSPVDASIISTSTPIFTMVIAAFYLREPVTAKKVTGIFIGAVGALMLIVSNGGSATAQDGNVWGDIICIAAEVCFASYLVVFKGLISRYSPITLMKWMFTYSSICIIPFSYTDLAALEWGGMGAGLLAALAFIVVGATFVCYLLSPVGQKHLRPTVASMYCYVQPIVATGIVVFYWGTSSFNIVKVMAIALVFLGVYVVTQSKSRAELEAHAERMAQGTGES